MEVLDEFVLLQFAFLRTMCSFLLGQVSGRAKARGTKLIQQTKNTPFEREVRGPHPVISDLLKTTK